MTTRTLAALIVVGAMLIGAIMATATTAPPTDGDAAPTVTPSCPEHGKSGPCAKLNSEQREQIHAQIRQLREAGATREEIRAAVQETLRSFGVEAPKANCGAKKTGCRMQKAGCGSDTAACGNAKAGCEAMMIAGCGQDRACCSGDKDAEGNCEKPCDRQCCSEGGEASTSEPSAE